MRLTFLTIVQLISISVQAYILPLDTILNKTAHQAGASIIEVLQNVVIQDEGKDYIIHEKWLIEGDKNLRLTATGTGELKDKIHISYLYNSKKRSEVVGKNKIVKEVSPEFFEKLIVIKTAESYRAYLKDLNIVNKVRLSRAAGTINFAIGTPSSAEALSPQLWIDQELFHLNKIRFSTEADVEFSKFKDYGKEDAPLQYPLKKVVSWSGNTVGINVTEVFPKTTATIKHFYPDTLTDPSEIQSTGHDSLDKKIKEFYERFR